MEISLFSVPYALGRPRVGMGQGPDRLLDGGLDRSLRDAGHRVELEAVDLEEPFMHEIGAAFSLNRTLARRVASARSRDALPLVLTGNCNSALGILAGIAGDGAPAGVIWLDAHGDFNTPETSASGFLDGMALAVATGRCFRPLAGSIPGFRDVDDRHVILAGARDLDPAEADLIGRSSVTLLGPGDLDGALEGALDRLASLVDRAYLHIDLDVLDPSEGRANRYAAPDGPSLDGVLRLVRAVSSRLQVAAASLAAYDPSYDPDGRLVPAAIAIASAIVSS